MLEFQQKRKVRKMMYSWPSILVLGLIAVVFVRGAWNVYIKESQSRDYMLQAKAELDNASSSEQSLFQSVTALQTQAGVEADIRRKFRVVKPGEEIAVIVDNSASGSASEAAATSTGMGGFWHRVAGFFGF